MSLTPPDPIQFLKRDGLADKQAENRVEVFAEAQTPRLVTLGDEGPGNACSYAELLEEVRKLKESNLRAHARITGVKDLWKFGQKTYLNPNCDALETEIGMERLSNPKTNLLLNGGFPLWNAGVTLPLAFTATGAPTISRQTRRTGAKSDNYACRIAAGASAGSIAQVVVVKGSAKYKLAGYVNLAASATVTVSLVTDGASPTTVNFVLPAASVGVGGWFGFPRQQWDGVDLETPADATQVTVTLQVDANHTADFSDFQLVQGPRCDPGLSEPAPEDVKTLTTIGTLPVGYGTSGQHLQTDGAGTTSWATPTVNAAAIVKVQDESIANDVVLGDDAVLLLAVAAGEVCSFRAVLYVKAALATTGIQVAMTCPAGGVINYGVGRFNLTAQEFYGFSAASGGAIDIVAASWATTGQGMVVIEGSLIAGSAGNLVVQWAQSTTSGTNLTVAAGSSLSKVKQ